MSGTVRRRLLSRDLSFSMLDQIFVSGFNFAIGIATARALGVADFGLFALILMIASFTAAAKAHLLTVPMMTLAGSRPNRSNGYFTAITWLGLGASAIAGLLVATVIAGIFWARGESPGLELLAAAAATTFFQNHLGVVRRILFARREMRQAVAMDIARPLALVALVAIALGLGHAVNVELVFWLLSLSALLSALPATVKLMAHRCTVRLMRTVVIRHWPISRWMLLVLLVSLGQEQLIWIIVGVELGNEAIGGLRAGQYLLGLTHFIVLAMENFIPRTAAEDLRVSGTAGLKSYLYRQSALLGGAMCGLAVLIAIYAEQLLTLVFGAPYAVFADVTRIFAVVYVATVLRPIWSHYLRAIEETRSIFRSFLVSSIVGLALIYPLMTQFGVVGVALCIMIAQLVCLAGIIGRVLRHDRANGLNNSLSPVSGGAEIGAQR